MVCSSTHLVTDVFWWSISTQDFKFVCDASLLHRGDYRTGKRLNMRKVIPYIASQFRKDKIWLRRTKPSKREYQICLAVDDSSSMVDNHSKQVRQPDASKRKQKHHNRYSLSKKWWASSLTPWTLCFIKDHTVTWSTKGSLIFANKWQLCLLCLLCVCVCVCGLQLAFESLSVIINALTLLEVGQVSVCRWGYASAMWCNKDRKEENVTTCLCK